MSRKKERSRRVWPDEEIFEMHDRTPRFDMGFNRENNRPKLSDIDMETTLPILPWVTRIHEIPRRVWPDEEQPIRSTKSRKKERSRRVWPDEEQPNRSTKSRKKERSRRVWPDEEPIRYMTRTKARERNRRYRVKKQTHYSDTFTIGIDENSVKPILADDNISRKEELGSIPETLRNHLYSIRNEKNISSEPKDDSQSGCVLCLLQADKEKWRKEHPVALLSIIGGSGDYLPTAKIRGQLKIGLLEITKTTNIWIITEKRNPSIEAIVKEVTLENFGEANCRVFQQGSFITMMTLNLTPEGQKRKWSEDSFFQQEIKSIEACILEHLTIPLIPIIIGGGGDSFEIVMSYLERKVPVLLLDGSGSTADFISKGYSLIMNRKSFREMFSEIYEAAKLFLSSYGYQKSHEELEEQLPDEEKAMILAWQLVDGLENNQKLIYVYSVNEATYTLERTIQDILVQLFCEGQQVEIKRERYILHFVNLWNRPDIAKTFVFNVENRRMLQTLEEELGDPNSSLAQLFRISLVRGRLDFVSLVLENIQIKTLYQEFLNQNLKTLYKLDQSTNMNIVKMINETVIQILGSREMKPFTEDDERKGIQEKDIFKHLFIWSVLMDRRDLAILFWQKEDKDFICSALYASALAKRLAENPLAEEHTDHLVALWESHRYYEDLAYSVMTKMYWKDKTQAQQLLVTEAERYNSNTIFEITEKFALMKFMGHAACQTKLKKIWKGRILNETSTLKAVTAAFIPILITKIVKIEDGPSTGLDTTAQKNNNYGTSSQATKTLPNWMRKIYYFYHSPLPKFCSNVLAYMAMLVMFSMFVLTDLHPIPEKSPSVMEYIVYAWAASTFAEEIRQAFGIKQVSLNLTTWFSFWTIFEILMYSLFIISVLLRLTLSAEDFYHARMMYSITLGLFIINSMQFFLVSKRIGPKVIMIGRMMFDIIFFILIFAVFLFGFGVIYQATMFPNSQPGFQLFKEIIYMPYWQLFGELFLDNLEGKEPSTCTNDVTLYRNGTIARCPEVNQMNTVLLAVYMVVTHIILVNILIAMFSHTFTKVQDNNLLVWKFHRFSLIREYYDRSSLVPPFIIISHMRRVFMCIFSKSAEGKKNKFKMRYTTASKKLAILERESVYRHLNSSVSSRTYQAKDTEDVKNGFEARYENKY